MSETVPADIAAAITAYGDAMREMSSKNARSPKATVARNIAKGARDELDAAIIAHLRKADDLKAALDRIVSGGA